MTERLDLFSTPILKTLWPGTQQHNQNLLQAIRQQRAASYGVQRSNIGGWQSEVDMAHWAGSSAIALAEYATNVAGEHMTDIHPKGKRTFGWHIEMWASINPPGAAHQLHCHPGAYWSGIYFLDPGGSDQPNGGGELIFEDPRYPAAYMAVPNLVLKQQTGEAMHSQYAIRPQAGLLVLFPSWLRHSVTQHRGDRESISIAINLMVAEVDQLPLEPAQS